MNARILEAGACYAVNRYLPHHKCVVSRHRIRANRAGVVVFVELIRVKGRLRLRELHMNFLGSRQPVNLTMPHDSVSASGKNREGILDDVAKIIPCGLHAGVVRTRPVDHCLPVNRRVGGPGCVGPVCLPGKVSRKKLAAMPASTPTMPMPPATASDSFPFVFA